MKAVTRAAVLSAAVACVLASLPAAATSYVPVSDLALLERSSAVIEARVLSIEPAPVREGWPATDYLVEVRKLVAGEVGGRNLLVRLPGGDAPDGTTLRLYGIPQFGIGENVLLFLTPGDDGTYRVAHLMLGAFRERVISGRRVLLRDLEDAQAVEMPGAPPAERTIGPRDAAAFTRWVTEAEGGRVREADYFLAEEEIQGVERVTADFRLFDDAETGLNIRWFDFDAGQNVDFYIASGGQPGFGESATAAAARTAIGAWNSAQGTNIRYRYAGTTGNSSLNVIWFDNAANAIDEAFDCASGGVLAVGGPTYFRQVTAPGPNGNSYHRITRARIVTNKNIQCFLERTPNSLEQLLAHELGHTLAIHHPCGGAGGKNCNSAATALERDALMYPFIHRDDRGARINEDDRAAARTLYPGSGGGGTPPVAPSGLTAAALSSSEVELAWSDNSHDETQFRIEGRAAGGPWQRVATTGSNATGTVVGGLLPATPYSFRVQSRRGTVASAFSAEAQATTLPNAPLAPSSLAGSTISETGVLLTWSDESNDETGFLVEVRTPAAAEWTPLATVPPDTTSLELDFLPTGVPHSFRVLALGSEEPSLPSEVVSLTPHAPDAPCGGSPEVLCLHDRFRVTVDWNNPHSAGGFGIGTAAAFAGDQSGTFWFFDPQNVELIVKILDGDALNGHFWVFHGALTDVEYWISVLDTETGRSRTYYNPPFDRCGEFDTTGIPAAELPASTAGTSLAFPNRVRAEGAGTSGCGDDVTLCLLDGRFELEVEWVNQHFGNATGVGHAVTGSDQTGYFWFFDASNIELVVKMIDARPFDGRFWVFFGSLSDVEYSLTVTDTATQQQRSYSNAPGNQCGLFDTDAFPIVGPGLGAR